MGHRIRGHRFGVVGDFGGVPIGYYAVSDYGTLVFSLPEGQHHRVKDEFPGKQLAAPSLSNFNEARDCLNIQGDRLYKDLLFAQVDGVDMFDVWVADAYMRRYEQCCTGSFTNTRVGEERKAELRKAFERNKSMKKKFGWTYGRLQETFAMADRVTPQQLDALYGLLGFTIDQRLLFNQRVLAFEGMLQIAQVKASLDQQLNRRRG